MKKLVSFLAATSMALALIPAGFARNASTVPGLMERYKTQTGMSRPADKGTVKNAMMGTVMSIIKNRLSARRSTRSIREVKEKEELKRPKRVAAPLKYFIASSAPASSATTSAAASTAASDAASSAMSGTTSSAAASTTSSN